MSLLGGFRADQLIGQLVSETDVSSRNALQLVERLKNLGPKTIPRVIDALAMSDKTHTMLFVDILARISTNSIVWVLSLMASASMTRGIVFGPRFLRRSTSCRAFRELTSVSLTS